MEEIINGLKQIKTRVDSGTITTVNGTETLLSKQLEKMIEEAINYTHCFTELKCDCGNTEDVKNIPICASCYNPHTGEWQHFYYLQRMVI